ncbi:MAG TPA: hypothetical protein DIT65_00470 [Cryomorphaceae bacterium]|nr:hypothetical protein [Cryomorphaceae bacterium]|tara:strand:- start:190 stop:666 length:477 start_codon:yes stop_codon:yes gene_type:complete
MKKIALIAAIGLLAVACTKWENRSTEYKVTGLWTGVNQELQVQASPFLDTNDLTATPYTEANFMENGSLTIDSAGVRIDSMGWSIKNDTILVLDGIDLGFDNPLGGGPSLVPSNLEFEIRTLTQDQFNFRFDTVISLSIPLIPVPVNLTLKQIQRWER